MAVDLWDNSPLPGRGTYPTGIAKSFVWSILGKQVVDIPLNGRSYTDLLAVQAGVSPITTSGAGNTSSGDGFGTVPAAGETNTGQFSIHGQRESDNAYYLNGASVQETIGQQAGIIPNLDSIAEFRILSAAQSMNDGGKNPHD
jgi:hypothetical protein